MTDTTVEALQQELKRTQDLLAAKTAELDAYVYSVSHDFRAPLRSINQFAELLERRAGDVLDERNAAYLKRLHDASMRADDMMVELLEISRFGREGANMTQVGMSGIVDNALRALGELVAETGARIDRGPMPTLETDPALLGRAVQELLDNAMRYVEPGTTPEIMVAADEVDNEIIISVVDNGIGMNQEHLANCFTVFKRAEILDAPGSGCGLSFVTKAASVLGGRTWAESQEGRGSKFFIALPR